MDILHAEVYAAGADGLGKTVVRVVLMMREYFFPAFDQGRRNGLRADVHEPPLVEAVVLELDVPAVNGVENVLRPRHEQPDDRRLFLRDGADDPFRRDTAKDHCAASGEQTAEPMHLRSGMIEGRDAEEHVVARLSVMVLLHTAGGDQGEVLMQDRLREARRAGGEIDRRIVVLVAGDGGSGRRTIGHEAVIAVGKLRYVGADVKEIFEKGQIEKDGLNTGRELGPENEHGNIRELGAVTDLIRGIAVVHRNCERAGLQNAEIYGQPFKAVHEQDRDFVAFFNAAGQEKIGEAVCLDIEFAPRHFPAVAFARSGFDQGKLTPGEIGVGLVRGIELYESDLVRVELRVSFEEFGDDHVFVLL